MSPLILPNEALFPLYVPTATVLATRARSSSQFLFYESAKHNDRLVASGGKLHPSIQRQGRSKFSWEDPATCARREFHEETKLKILDMFLFATRTDRTNDVRIEPLGRITGNACDPSLADKLVEAYYGAPDYIYLALVGDDEPTPDQRETKNFQWVDVLDNVDFSATRFGAEHHIMALALRRWFISGGWTGSGKLPSCAEMADYDTFYRALSACTCGANS